MALSPRMGLTICSLTFAAAAAGTLGAAESASAQSATVVPRHAVTNVTLADHYGHGRHWRRHGRSSSSSTYYKRTTFWFFGGGCGCCC
jgi:hypothetical protein